MNPRVAWWLLAPALAFVSLFFVLPQGSKPGLTHLAWRVAQVPVRAAGAGETVRDAGTVPGRVVARSYLGEAVQYLVDTALGPVKGGAGPDAAWQEGDAVCVQLDPARAAWLRMGSGQGAPSAQGEPAAAGAP